MPAAAEKPLGATDAPRPPLDDDDDDDDELIDDDEDLKETVSLALDLHPSPPISNPPPPITLDLHRPNFGVDDEDLPTSSSSSAAEEDDDNDHQLILIPPSSSSSSAPNNILALPNPFSNGSGTLPPPPALPPSELTPSPKRLRIAAAADDVKPTPTPPPSDDSRRLFQRLWTDEDEIELLQGFLEFTGQRSSNQHHQDTTVFYDQIKPKLQVDFNKNQLVEKLRRLKKKYRNAMNRINSCKDFAFKSPHEQATFNISSQIWNSAASLRAQIPTANVDDANNNGEDPAALLHNNGGGARLTTRKRTRAARSTPPDGGGHSPATATAAAAAMGGGGGGGAPASVVMDQYQQQQQHPSVMVAGYSPLHHTLLAPPANPVSAAVPMSLIEDTVRSCLSPLFKELLQCAVTNSGAPTPHGLVGGGLSANPLVPQFMGWNVGGGGPAATTIGGGAATGGLMNHSDSMDERLRRQQILELEVYSKRLELVQEQIKVALEDLKSKGG